MKSLKAYVERRTAFAQSHVDRIKQEQGPNPASTYTYHGGYELGYWESKITTYDFMQERIEQIENKYRDEIVWLRGKAHMSCPACGDDCIGWVTDGEPCRKDWEL